jgi:hypothetical protein
MNNNLEVIKKEIDTELEKIEIQKALLLTTFKGFDLPKMKMAMFEGMSRGFSFKDFLEKNIYAISYGNGYSLITSIDYARKLGMRSGVVGKSKPEYVEKDNKIISCSITIKKKVGETIGDFTSEVYFDEFYNGNKKPDGTTKQNNYGEVKPTLWDTKPRVMIAKVAEMHALRMACPEELSQAYVEEEVEKENIIVVDNKIPDEIINLIEQAVKEQELTDIWNANKDKGYGKGFVKLLSTQKAFIKKAEESDEKNTQNRTEK